MLREVLGVEEGKEVERDETGLLLGLFAFGQVQTDRFIASIIWHVSLLSCFRQDVKFSEQDTGMS